MRRVIKNRKWIAWSVILSFLFLTQVSSLPARAESVNGVFEVVENEDTQAPGAIERSASKTKAKKKSIVPYILIGVGVVAVGALVYFLVIKKKEYTLTVNLGEGIQGNPAAGSHTYKKGDSVSYNYELAGGFKDLQVQIDGASAAASGSITMNGDHTISATSTKVASIAVTSTPTGAMIFDNNVNTGRVTNAVLEYPAGGSHTILLRRCGYQDSSHQVEAVMGTQQNVDAALKEGIYDEFVTSELASCWRTVDNRQWQTGGDKLYGRTENNSLNPMMYDVPFSGTQYTATARMSLKSGNLNAFMQGIMLSEGTDLNNLAGYLFAVYNNSAVVFFRMDGYHPYHMSGALTLIWAGPVLGLNGGYNVWNKFKVVRSGNTYTFSVNDVVQQTYTLTDYNPRYTSILFGSMFAAENECDFIRQDMGASASPQNVPPAFKGGTPITGNIFEFIKNK